MTQTQKIAYPLIAIAVVGIFLLIFWPRNNNSKIDKINQENVILKEQIKQKDSIIEYYHQESEALDNKIDTLTLIQIKDRIIYKDRIKEIPQYQQYQIDSFFKQRYK